MGSVQSKGEFNRCFDYYKGDDVLSTTNDVIMENILMHLDVKDLSSLCKTSKKMKEHVQSFALHYVLSYSRMQNLHKFLQCGLLNPTEKAESDRITQCGDPNVSTSLYFLKCIKLYGQNIRRYSITEADEFTHYGNQNYIVREYSQLLRRDVVYLKTVCWLYFKQSLPNVPAGKYHVSIHFLLGETLHWPSGRLWGGNNKRTAQLKVIDENGDKDDPPLVEVEMEPEYWAQIKANKFQNGLLQGNAIVTENGNNWRLITFKKFRIEKPTNLAFIWKDIENPWWKNGMYWDYVEIKEV